MSRRPSKANPLSLRQRKVLKLYYQGVKLSEIAVELHISEKLALEALYEAQDILGVETPDKAMHEAWLLGWIKPGGPITVLMQPRWAQVAELVLRGLSDAEIVAQLGVSKASVRGFLARLMRHVGVPPHDRARLIVVLKDNGWSATGRGNGDPAQREREPVELTDPVPMLTEPLEPRLAQVAELLMLRLSNLEIARRLGISPGNAGVYVSRLGSRLNVSSRDRARLIAVLERNGWAPGVRGNGDPERHQTGYLRRVRRRVVKGVKQTPEGGEDL